MDHAWYDRTSGAPARALQGGAMRRSMLLVAAALVLVLAACNTAQPAPDATDTPDPTEDGEVRSLQVTPSSVLLTEAGEQRELTVRAFDADGREVPADDLEFVWSNSDPDAIRLAHSGGVATVAAEVFLGSATVTVSLRSDPEVAAPVVHVVDARLHDGVELVADARIVFPLVGAAPGAPPDRLPDIDLVGSGLVIGGFGEEEVADRFEIDPATGALWFPVVLRDEAPPVGALLLAGEGGGFAGEVVWSETRGAFSLVQLRPTPPGSVFHDLKVAGASRRTQTIDAASLGPMAAEQPGAVQPQSKKGLLDKCSVEGTVGSFALTPTATLQADVDGVLEIRDGDAVPERFMLLVAVQAELHVEAVLELGGTMQGKIACELGLAKWDLPFPGYLAPFFSARTALDLVSAITLEVTNGPQLTGTAAATVSGSAVVGFDYLEGQVVDLSDLAAPTITVEEPLLAGDAGIDDAVVDFRLGSYLRFTPGVVLGGAPAKVLEDLADSLPSGSGWLAYLQEKVKTAIDLTFVDMAELELGPELQATWMGNLAVLENRASTSYGGKNFKITSAVKSDALDAIAGFIGLSTLPRFEFPRIDIPGLSLFRPFAPGVVEVTTKTRSGPVGQGEVIAVRAGETIDVFASGEYTFALAPLVDAPLEYGEVWLDHGSYVDELPLGLGNVLAGIVTISEEMCGEGPFQLAILGYNRMFTVATAGYLGAITLECQEAGVALSPKDLWFGAQVNEAVEASFSLTNVDEPGGDLVHYEIVTDGDWLSLLGDAQGVIVAGDVVTLGMSGQCPDEPTFLAGGFAFSFVREDSQGDRFPLTDNVPSSMPVFLQCFEEEEEDDVDEEDMGVGSSHGDPWLLTPDGTFYAFHAVGDYVLVASTEPGDPFEVQVRFRPFPGNWSANDALAMRVVDSVVNVYATDESTLDVLIDGVVVSEGAHEIPGGGSVTFAGMTASVTWPDLTQVSISTHRQTIGAVTVVLPPGRRGKVEGLMGSFDGDPVTDLRIRGGALLVDPSEEELYQDFRWSWRVPLGSAASLFVDGPDYWDPLYPTNVVRLEDLDADAVRWAAGICTELGIVDRNILRSCVFDVALTGDEGWATVAAGVDPRILGVNVTPQLSYLVPGASRQFGAVVSGTADREIVWSATGGTITRETPNIMTYTAPSAPGAYSVTARLAADGSVQQTVSVIVVEAREVDLGVSRVLAAGGGHNLAVTDEGAVLAWGRNHRGQVGDGTMTNRSLPVEVAFAHRVRSVAAGHAHSLALLEDGSVWAWGDNFGGQLGTGDTTARTTPTRVVGLERVAMIAAGGESSFALLGDGTLWAWGDNFYGQLGVGTAGNAALEPERVTDLTGVVAVAASYDHTLALTETGRVWAWGSNFNGQFGDGTTLPSPVPREIETLAGVTALATGYGFSLALVDDGTVRAWGSNAQGLLGTGSAGDVLVPTPVAGLSDVVALAAGDNFSAALGRDGSVWTWGFNGAGQLGDGSTANRASPVRVAHLDDAEAIVIGGSHGLAVRADGAVWGWGQNASGQLGNGSDGSGNRYPWPGPVYLDRTVELDGVVALGGGMALRSDGTLWGWGANTIGQLGVGHNANSSVAVRTLNVRDPIAFAADNGHRLALLPDGTVWAWGSESNGRLGNGVSTNTHRPVPLPVHDLSDAVDIAIGLNYSLALRRDGTVWGWGFNSNGELGVGDTTHRSLPEQVVGPGGVGHLSGVVSISAGGSRSFAITEDGTLWAWGARATETDGGIEIGSPVPVEASRLPDDIDMLTDVVGLAHGDDDHSLALLRDGSVWAWGANGVGQLGDGTTTGRRQAVQVRLSGDEFLEDAVAIAAGWGYSLAIREDGSLWGWGFNRDGQLGNGTSRNTSATPGPVSNLSGVSAVGALRITSFAQLDDGTVWGWGNNWSGAVGDGTVDHRSVPVRVLARVPLAVSLPAEDGGASALTVSRLSGDVTVGDAGAGRRAVAPLGGATLHVAAHAGEAVALEAREGDAGVVVLRASLRAPAGSTGALLRAVTLDALVPGGATNPADLVSRVSVYLASGPGAAQPLGAPVAAGASFDAAGRIVLRLDEPARVREGEAVGLLVTYDIARRTGLRPAAGASLLALLLGSPLLLRTRGAGVARRARTLLAGALLWVALAGCAQTLTEVMPQARQVQAVLTGVEFAASDARAGAGVSGLPVQGAVVTVGPAAPPAPSVARP